MCWHSISDILATLPQSLKIFFWQTTVLPYFMVALVVNNPSANAGEARDRFDSRVRKIPWSRKWQPIWVFLPEKFHGQMSLVDYSPRGCQELDTAEWLSTHTAHSFHLAVLSIWQRERTHVSLCHQTSLRYPDSVLSSELLSFFHCQGSLQRIAKTANFQTADIFEL